MLYEAILCIWLLTYYEPAFEAMAEAQVLSRLVEVVKLSTKEKVHVLLMFGYICVLSAFGDAPYNEVVLNYSEA